MEQAPRKVQTVTASLLLFTLGLPAAVHPEPVEGYTLRQASLEESKAKGPFLKEIGYSTLSVRPPTAGAEAFFGEYHPALGTLAPSRQEEILQWMDYDGMEIREVTLPDWVPIYVRGKELLGELLSGIKNPQGVVFEWKLLPLKPGEDWERVGLILNDLGRQGSYDGDNPNGLRIRDVRQGEAAQLNAALLLAEALATLPPGSVLLGAELLPDSRGRVRLILFSA
jgi:hypothetical protein